MIELTKLNGEPILINPELIEYIEVIPECKIIMQNNKFHIVTEDKDTIRNKVIEYRFLCNNLAPKKEVF